MITIDIPGRGELHLERLVTDFNGTIAEGGRLLAGVDERLRQLAERMRVIVLTADTFGRAQSEASGLPVEVVILARGGEDVAKAEHVAGLGSATTVALGNGHNDRLMLDEAELGLAVVQGEGAARSAWVAADVVFGDVCDALDALLDPQRLVATLRS